MAKVAVDHTRYSKQLYHSLGDGGALVMSLDSDGRPNPMTIGWATLGSIWSLPICTILVRPSRYTFSCLNITGDFTLCLPYPQMRSATNFCGTHSGRDHDKLAECNLTGMPSESVKSPGIAECGVIWECRIVYTDDLNPDTLAPEIIRSAYVGDDYHRFYYGLVERCCADPNFEADFFRQSEES